MMFLRTRLSWCFVVLCSLFSSLSFAQSQTLSQQLDAVLQSKIPRAFNGVVIVAQRGNIVYEKAVGYADLETKRPLKMSDQFGIGSNSKQVTATLVLQEIEKGHFKLTDTVKKLLPELNTRWADSITVQQLLNHTSGLVTQFDYNLPLQFTPGAKYSYSNFGYLILARIIARSSKRSYAQLTAALFKRCNLQYMTAPQNYKTGTLVSSYMEQDDSSLQKVTVKDALEISKPNAQSGGLIATAADLLRWDACLHSGLLLQASSYKKMTTPGVQFTHRWGEIGYGYGLQLDNQDGVTEISHGGIFLGFMAANYYYPETQTTVIILENIFPRFNDKPRVYFYQDTIRKLVKESNLVAHSN